MEQSLIMNVIKEQITQTETKIKEETDKAELVILHDRLQKYIELAFDAIRDSLF